MKEKGINQFKGVINLLKYVLYKFIRFNMFYIPTVFLIFLYLSVFVEVPETKELVQTKELSVNNFTSEFIVQDKICETHFIDEIKAYVADCSHRDLTQVPRNLKFEDKHCLNPAVKCIVNLNNNQITNFGYENEHLFHITHLYLANNSLKSVLWLPWQLQELDLSNNSLRVLGDYPKHLVEDSSSLILALHDNPWHCSPLCINFFLNTSSDAYQRLVNRTIMCEDNIDWHTTCEMGRRAVAIGASLGFTFLCFSMYCMLTRERNWVEVPHYHVKEL